MNIIFVISVKKGISLSDFQQKNIFRKFIRTPPSGSFLLKNTCSPLRSIFRKMFFLLKITQTNAFFYADYEYDVHFCFEVQIFLLNCRRKLGIIRKYRKKRAIFTFVGKS